MKTFQWAVIGAGGAGIAAVGKLLDYGIKPDNILWVDPNFTVGDLGLLWSNVSSNTKVSYFTDFLLAATSFAYREVAQNFQLYQLDPNDTCILKYVVEPLQWISHNLALQVTTQQTTIDSIYLSHRVWSLCSATQIFKAHNVILATGTEPLGLDYPQPAAIAFQTAIDKEKLAQVINREETYAVFGSSHSAMIIMRHLVELQVKKLVNFYRTPCRYAINMGDWILFDNTGLKGQAAAWARENIDGRHPANLLRYIANSANITTYLPVCDKVIYAIGFSKRNAITIGDYDKIDSNPHVGILAPGLFGLGIAYPELKADPLGNFEMQVGLWKFMLYLKKVMPLWLQYSA